MTVEFFGIRGPGQIGNVNKTNRPDATEKSGDSKEASFSSALEGAKVRAGDSMNDTERAERVQSIKDQVANGSYDPDLHKVASSLLRFLVEEG